MQICTEKKKCAPKRGREGRKEGASCQDKIMRVDSIELAHTSTPPSFEVLGCVEGKQKSRLF